MTLKGQADSRMTLHLNKGLCSSGCPGRRLHWQAADSRLNAPHLSIFGPLACQVVTGVLLDSHASVTSKILKCLSDCRTRLFHFQWRFLLTTWTTEPLGNRADKEALYIEERVTLTLSHLFWDWSKWLLLNGSILCRGCSTMSLCLGTWRSRAECHEDRKATTFLHHS